MPKRSVRYDPFLCSAVECVYTVTNCAAPPGVSRAVLKEPVFCFCKGPPLRPPQCHHQPPTATTHQHHQTPLTANHQPLPTASGYQPPTANYCQPPPTTHHQPLTAAIHHHPPPTASCQLPTANRRQPLTANRHQPWYSTLSARGLFRKTDVVCYCIEFQVFGAMSVQNWYRNTFFSPLRTARGPTLHSHGRLIASPPHPLAHPHGTSVTAFSTASGVAFSTTFSPAFSYLLRSLGHSRLHSLCHSLLHILHDRLLDNPPPTPSLQPLSVIGGSRGDLGGIVARSWRELGRILGGSQGGRSCGDIEGILRGSWGNLGGILRGSWGEYG